MAGTIRVRRLRGRQAEERFASAARITAGFSNRIRASMTLQTGTYLGPYEIISPIGAGEMGEVYRARDSRLAREVAIKVSAERFTERFEREARTIARG